MREDKVYAVDFESYYDNEVSITTLGTWHYLRHPECDIYLVSIVGPGVRWAGHPSEAPWDKIAGEVWVSHNASFDEKVQDRLEELGVVPAWARPSVWHCTADMAAYLGSPRSLALACADLLGTPVSKATRDKMSGKQWRNMGPDFRREVVEYALKDSELCLRLWTEHSSRWPDWEREVSLLTRRQVNRGVMVDVDLVNRSIVHLDEMRVKATRDIPWVQHGEKPLSYPAFCDWCRKHGMWVPNSLAEDSEECEKWEAQFGETVPWARAMRTLRRSNSLLKKFERLLSLVRPDGRAMADVKYCGAFTRRWSGAGGLNFQNMSRDELLGTEMRKCLIAAPGKKIVASDLSQIEPRCSAVLSGDQTALELMKRYDIYESHARATMGYDRPESLKSLGGIPEYERMRRLAKARCLSGDTLVLTKRGYLPVSKILLTDMVWDGRVYATHGGVICSGRKQTIDLHGDSFTSDHQIFISEDETLDASEARRSSASQMERERSSLPYWDEVWALARAIPRVLAQCWRSVLSTFKLRVRAVWDGTSRELRQPRPRKDREVQLLRSRRSPNESGLKKVGA